MRESLIRVNLKDGSSILVPFSKWINMSDEDFKDLDTGNYGRFKHIQEDTYDINEVNTIDDELEEYDTKDDDIFDIEYDDQLYKYVINLVDNKKRCIILIQGR